MKGIAGILKLPFLKDMIDGSYYAEIIKEPYRARSLLEVYLKKLILKKTPNYNENDFKEFEIWLSFFLDNYRYLQEHENIKEKYTVKY